MNTVNALIHGYLLDGKGGGNALDWDAIDTWTPDKGLLWVHLDSTVAESSSWLMEKSGMDPLICESLLDPHNPCCDVCLHFSGGGKIHAA